MTTKEQKPSCKCACHNNVLHKPYEHDTRCCEQINGMVVDEKAASVKYKAEWATSDTHRWDVLDAP